MSELVAAPFQNRCIAEKVKGIELVKLDRVDECCGFGGTFLCGGRISKCKNGADRVADHEKNNVQVITGGDMSCLMHLGRYFKRKKKNNVVIKHIAEILNGEGKLKSLQDI